MTETLPVSPGDVVGGKYVIERLLGQGGMGAVFVARQEQLGRRVAIKFLLSTTANNPEALARFEREARAVAVLQSDNVSKVHDVGRLDGGTPYMVMELLDGEDLASVLAKGGPLPIAQAVRVVAEACDAIGEAHGLGIVHRDIKPANLFLCRRASGATLTKVLDFGISKATGVEGGVALTTASAVMGSVLYMSPEQLRESRNVDRRADIWALGATLYELLTGGPPFSAEAFAEVCSKILTAEPVPPRQLRPEIPEDLEAVVLKCLAKDPAARFDTVGALVDALRSSRSPSDAPADLAYGATIPSGSSLRASGRTPASRPRLAQGEDTANPVSSSRSAEAHQPASTLSKALVLSVLGLAGTAAVVLGVRASRTVSPAGSAASQDLPAPTVSTVTGATSAVAAATPSTVAAEPPTSPPAPISQPAATTLRPASAGSDKRPAVIPRPAIAVAPPVATPPNVVVSSTASVTTAAKAAPTCHAESYFDSDGNKHFRQVCP